jgi:hypothetical protein
MTKSAANVDSKQSKPDVELLVDEPEVAEFDADDTPSPPPRASNRDPAIRRKIEDRLERIRLREELGIYDDKYLADL